MKSVPQQASSSLGNAAATPLGASASGGFFPILSTSSEYQLHTPQQGVCSFPVDSALALLSASEAAVETAHCEKSLALQHAREAYETVQRAYDRAVTLTQTQEIARIWPALRSAKLRLLAAEMGA